MTCDELTLAVLEEEARSDAPRMFALYGVVQHRLSDEDDGGYLGWGMEFAEPTKAVMWTPDGATFISDSAEHLLRTHTQLGEARLVWLTEWPDSSDYGLAGG